MEINDGGPAFPAGDPIYGTSGGMSLRDYFATKALAPILECALKAASNAPDEFRPDAMAGASYMIADAMLRARSAQSPAEKQAEHLREFGK